MVWVLCSILLFSLLILVIFVQHKNEIKKLEDNASSIRSLLQSERNKKMAEKTSSNTRKSTPYLSDDAYAVVTHKKLKREEPAPELTLLQQRYMPRQVGKLPVVEGEWQVVTSKKKKSKQPEQLPKVKKIKSTLKPVCVSIPIKQNFPLVFSSLKDLCIQVLFYPKVEYKGQCLASYNSNVRKKCFSLANDVKLDIMQRLRPISNDLISCYDNDLMTDAILFMFSPVYLTQLDLSWCKHITLPSLLQIVDICGENIYSLILSGCTQFSEQDQFISILKRALNIKELNLAWCTNLVKDEMLDYLSLSKHQIEYLNLKGCELFTSTLVAEIIKKLPLVYLNLAYCRQIDDSILDSIFQYRTSTLHTLDLTCCEYLLGVKPPKIKFDNLNVLLLRGCDRLAPETIVAWARLAGHNLVHFEFSEPHRKTEDFIEQIGPLLTPKLEKYIIDITRGSLDALISSISHCINLVELGNFYNCTYLDSWGNISESSMKILSTFTKLQSLEWSMECDPKIDIVFSKLKDLRKFACYSYEFIPGLLPLLSTHCTQLEVLKLSPFKNRQSQQIYPENELISLVHNLPNLKVLHLSDRGVTENVLKAIASSCSQLQDLDISSNKPLLFSSVVHLIRSCTELKKLNLTNCVDVPVTQLVSVVSSIAPKLILFESNVSHFPTNIGSFARKGVDHVEFRLIKGEENVIDIYINNTLLQTKVKEVEMSFDPDLAGKYYSLTPTYYWAPPAMIFDMQNGAILLGCDCGIVECWPLAFNFVQEGNLFIWTKVTNYHRSSTWSWKKMQSSIFDVKDYVELLQPFAV